MDKVSIIGLDLAKRVFQAHGACVDGTVLFRRKLMRDQVLRFFGEQPRCIVAMEACASAHHWGREISALGHEVRLIPPAYVKPYVKRQKNDASDAEAICEAASRKNMRFVAIKSAEKQASAVIFKTRDLLVRQRSQSVNALRGHLGEFGVIAPKGISHADKLADWVESADCTLPRSARDICFILIEQIRSFSDKIGRLDAEVRQRAKQDDVAKRLMTIPGIGPVIATAIEALAPAPETFKRGRDFAAWMGLAPRQFSSGGKTKLGATSKMGQRDLRRLMIIGASSVVRWAARMAPKPGSWLAQMLDRKPKMLVTMALANKMARIVWALMTSGDEYRPVKQAATVAV